MSLTPRAVVVRRPTELEELIARHGTRGQAAFFLSTRGRHIDEVEERHQRQQSAMTSVTSALPLDWRRGAVLRADLPRFPFAPEDLIIVVGQDGLVANVSKYLKGQPVIGVNPDPERNPGVLVPFTPEVAAQLLQRVSDPTRLPVEARTMVWAELDDGQSDVASDCPVRHCVGRRPVREASLIGNHRQHWYRCDGLVSFSFARAAQQPSAARPRR